MHTGWDKPLLIRRNAGEPAWAGCRHNGRKAAPFWTLLPSFLFLAIIFSIHSNGEAIAQQRAAWRDNRAVDFRQVQGTMTGAGVSNVKAGIGGAVPNIINPGTISFTQITGVAARRLGYCIGFIIIVAAFLPKVSGLIASIPAPVMAGYLMLVCGTLLVEGRGW